MNERIVNIYSFETKTGIISYIYSSKKPQDDLGFDYYILTNNEKEEPVRYEANNALKILQNNNMQITPIQRDSLEYAIFLSKLSQATKTSEKKEEVLSRK